jgi:hypothetical protein
MNKKKELSVVKEKPQENMAVQVDDKMKYLYSLSGNFTVS